MRTAQNQGCAADITKQGPDPIFDSSPLPAHRGCNLYALFIFPWKDLAILCVSSVLTKFIKEKAWGERAQPMKASGPVCLPSTTL